MFDEYITIVLLAILSSLCNIFSLTKQSVKPGFSFLNRGIPKLITIRRCDRNDRIFGNPGNDTIDCGAGDDVVFGGKNNDLVLGADGNDSLRGDRAQDTLTGGSGDDLLFGGKGFDLLLGGDGNDTLSGDLGKDTLTGGLGNDLFVLRQSAGTTDIAFADAIADFQVGIDAIGLAGGLSEANLSLDADGSNTVIRIVGSAQILAVVNGVTPGQLQGSFVTANITFI